MPHILVGQRRSRRQKLNRINQPNAFHSLQIMKQLYWILSMEISILGVDGKETLVSSVGARRGPPTASEKRAFGDRSPVATSGQPLLIDLCLEAPGPKLIGNGFMAQCSPKVFPICCTLQKVVSKCFAASKSSACCQ